MKLLTWNMNHWQNTCTGNKNQAEIEKWRTDSLAALEQFDEDFMLLQEVNPYYLYGIDFKRRNPPFYHFSLPGREVYYHELSAELAAEGVTDNFWGTAIITGKNYKLVKNHFDTGSGCAGEYYYGRNALMCYDFESPDGTLVSLINFYNKCNRLQNSYTMLRDIQGDILKMAKANTDDHLLILAGDFNINENDTRNDNMGIFDCIKQAGFVNCTKNIETTVVFSKYRDDHIFLNASCYEKTMNRTPLDPRICADPLVSKLSDHYPLECAIEL